MMKRYSMVIDTEKCVGCYNCVLACKDEFCGNDYPPYSLSQPMTGSFWMNLSEKERGQYPKVKVSYFPLPCQHCEDAACIKAGLDGAVYRRDDGIVIIDPEKAKGQKQLVNSCPYMTIYWNEDLKIAQKCNFCAHLLDAGWKEPRCVEACPTDALIFGDLDDPESNVSKAMASGKVEYPHPEYGMGEKVGYIGLPKRFIAGTVVFGDTDKCGEGATVTLANGGAKLTVQANNYGDFEFEGLEADQSYVVAIDHKGYQPKSITVDTKTDKYLGEIMLEATV